AAAEGRSVLPGPRRSSRAPGRTAAAPAERTDQRTAPHMETLHGQHILQLYRRASAVPQALAVAQPLLVAWAQDAARDTDVRWGRRLRTVLPRLAARAA